MFETAQALILCVQTVLIKSESTLCKTIQNKMYTGACIFFLFADKFTGMLHDCEYSTIVLGCINTATV